MVASKIFVDLINTGFRPSDKGGGRSCTPLDKGGGGRSCTPLDKGEGAVCEKIFFGPSCLSLVPGPATDNKIRITALFYIPAL